MEEMSADETLSFNTDVSDTRRQRKRRKLRKSKNPGKRLVTPELVTPAFLCGISTGFKPANACMPETCVLTQEHSDTRPAFCRDVQHHKGVKAATAEHWHKPRVLSR